MSKNVQRGVKTIFSYEKICIYEKKNVSLYVFCDYRFTN